MGHLFRVAIVLSVVILIFFAVTFVVLFVFFLVWLLSKGEIGNDRLMRRIGALWMYSAHVNATPRIRNFAEHMMQYEASPAHIADQSSSLTTATSNFE